MGSNFNLRETAIYQAEKQGRSVFFRFSGFFKNIFLGFLVLSLFPIGLSFLGMFSFISALQISVFFLVLFVILAEANLFLKTKISNPDLEHNIAEEIEKLETCNLAEFLTTESARIVLRAIKFCRKRKLSEVSAMALLYGALDVSDQANYIFSRLGMDIASIQDNIKNSLEKSKRGERFVEFFSEDFNIAMVEAARVVVERKRTRIEARDILVGISKTDFFEQILVENDLKIEDFNNLTLWFDYLERKIRESKKFWSKENLSIYGSMGRDFATGYTITLDQYSIDWRRIVKNWVFKAVIGHGKEIEDVQVGLAKPEANNVLIVGEAGTGRDSIIEGLARRAYLGKSLPELNHFRVVELDMVSMLSQINDAEKVESILDQIFQEVVSAGNVILVIKEFHNYVGLETVQPGMVDISGILGKYLGSPEFKFIGITNYNGLHTRIERNPSMLDQFTKIEVGEVTEEETMRILQNLSLELEQRYKVFVTYPAVREVVKLAARYIPSKPFPQKGIDLLQDVVVYVARSTKDKVVLPEHVAKIISAKTEIPVGRVEAEEKEMLLNLEKLIHERIVNQEEAVKEISIAMRRARAGIGSKKRPMGSFLFLGPTGVGKTETSKALATVYFKGEDKMIRLDMSEFQAVSDIPRLIGAPGQEGLLTTPVREKPFALLLMDEIEKAHRNILNLFLQVLDEGEVTDGQNRKTAFTNTIIICTSNAGSEMIWDAVGKNEPIDKDMLLQKLFTDGIFKPEFVNRFDAVVIFKPLTKDNLLKICELSLGSLKKSLREKDIEFRITVPLMEKIVELSYKPAYGAREMRRVIQDKVENSVAQALLGDAIMKGDSFEVNPEDFSLTKVESEKAEKIRKTKKVIKK